MALDPSNRGLALAVHVAEVMSDDPYPVQMTAISVLFGHLIQDWPADEREKFFLTVRRTAEHFANIFTKESCKGNA